MVAFLGAIGAVAGPLLGAIGGKGKEKPQAPQQGATPDLGAALNGTNNDSKDPKDEIIKMLVQMLAQKDQPTRPSAGLKIKA